MGIGRYHVAHGELQAFVGFGNREQRKSGLNMIICEV